MLPAGRSSKNWRAMPFQGRLDPAHSGFARTGAGQHRSLQTVLKMRKAMRGERALEELTMENLATDNIPYEYIDNGALILHLLREHKTWEALCSRFAYADPAQLKANTTTMTLLQKLHSLHELGLIAFKEEETEEGRKPVGIIEETDRSSRIRMAFGGMSLSDMAFISRHSTGMAVAPVFGRPSRPKASIDVFVLMPFKAKLEKVYTQHIRKLGDELGISIQRADDNYAPGPFMEKVWSGIFHAQLVLADCTEKNPNVFYEIGMAHTVGKQVALITRSEKDIPSDIKNHDFISYIYDPEGVDTLVDKLRAFFTSHLAL
jgi:hypothetical protein